MNGKSLYLLGRVPSPNSQPTIQETIDALQYEISRGETDYEQMLLNLLNH
jgi:hypothetical protein